MKDLTRRQQEVLSHIIAFHVREGRFPTGPEIANHFGFKDPSPAYQHLEALEWKGYLTINRYGYGRPAAIRLTDRCAPMVANSWPLLGSISAGPLTDAGCQVERHLSNLNDLIPQLQPGDFFMSVGDDSMSGAGIGPGQMVVIRPGTTPNHKDICGVWIDGIGSTISYLDREEELIRLIPANPEYPTRLYPADRVKIQGIVIATVAVTPFN
ncbi:MAG: LexA family transcriptional regulator [Candidatus Kapaibacterium sp.]